MTHTLTKVRSNLSMTNFGMVLKEIAENSFMARFQFGFQNQRFLGDFDFGLGILKSYTLVLTCTYTGSYKRF